uniref:Large ribosomal subunit protein bL32c n=1 Tax=Cryptomonas curvata TaxID=233186 RepID=A0A222AH85_9CRYP|nr:ribosomal protein L32 [Cryptomonas curvata]ASO75727.1 ribosomal protein L32 [Cryptomonas curvata]
MAVPKKRTSKSKKNSRLAKWTNKANLQAKKALSLAKSILSGKSTSFISNNSEENTVKEV